MDDLPDKNIFMACAALDRAALSDVAPPYRVRTCRRDELAWWKAVPFDGAATPDTDAFMDGFFRTAYGGQEDLFYARTLVVVDERNLPVATCTLWRAYGAFNTIHWFKVVQGHEGKGLGRALLSAVMRELTPQDYPVYLHTQPGSFRAIKLYSDFGFDLLSGGPLGTRSNDLEECLPLLGRVMPEDSYRALRVGESPKEWTRFLATTTTVQF